MTAAELLAGLHRNSRPGPIDRFEITAGVAVASRVATATGWPGSRWYRGLVGADHVGGDSGRHGYMMVAMQFDGVAAMSGGMGTM